MKLSTDSIRRIGNAVRVVEATGMRGGNLVLNPGSFTYRFAKITAVVEGSPDPDTPYIYKVDIYTGEWNDVPEKRTAVLTNNALWSSIPLEVGSWFSVVGVGDHWEVFGSAPSTGLPTASTAGQIIQWVALETVSGSTVAAHWEAVELGTLTDKSLLVWNGTSKRWTAQVPITSELVADIRYNTTDHCLEKKVVKGIVLTSATNSTSFTTISNGTFVAFPGTATT